MTTASPSLSTDHSLSFHAIMDLTQAWLHQNVQSYANRDRVFTDIDNILRRFQTLRPKSDVYSAQSDPPAVPPLILFS